MRYRSKYYFKIPFGEVQYGVQYGVQAHYITVWIGNRCFSLWRGSLRCFFGWHKWPIDSRKNNRVCLKCLKVRYK